MGFAVQSRVHGPSHGPDQRPPEWALRLLLNTVSRPNHWHCCPPKKMSVLVPDPQEPQQGHEATLGVIHQTVNEGPFARRVRTYFGFGLSLRRGCLTPAVSGAHMWAEWLHHPCLLWVPIRLYVSVYPGQAGCTKKNFGIHTGYTKRYTAGSQHTYSTHALT